MPTLDAVTERIWTIDGFLTPDECREWVAFAEEVGFEDAPITTSAGPVMAPDVRNNTRVMVDDVERADDLWQRIEPFVPRRSSFPEPIGLNERLRFYRYDPGQAFRWHFDGAYRRPNGERSHLTFMVYLNDDFEGGDTRFEETVVEPRTGRALLFVHRQLHEGAEITSGRKYVLRTDVMYPPG